MQLFRLSNHPLVRWWWSMDRPTFTLVLLLMLIGCVVVVTASSGVATDYRVDAFYFARRQVAFILASIPLLLVCSMLSHKGLKIVAAVMCVVGVVGVVATLFVGADVKGATRWLSIGPFKVQPSEFLKPAFILLTAWLLSSTNPHVRQKGFFASMVILGLLCLLFIAQPNFGMALVFGMVWFAQVFVAGASLLILVPMIALAVLGVLGGYSFLPHVRSRIDRFLDPDSGDTFQVDQAREALLSGGFIGRGPGEGVVKHTLPDAHTDFVFAVIGEEFGLVVCSLILLIYAIIVYRGFRRLWGHENAFEIVAGTGLLILFSLQVLVNVGVALHVLPTTGMTLPFISYGGSSTLALAMTVGFMFALTRKSAGDWTPPRRKAPHVGR